jgi:hypothetical protein
MNRRDFSKRMLILGLGAQAGCKALRVEDVPPSIAGRMPATQSDPGNYYEEPAKKLPIR